MRQTGGPSDRYVLDYSYNARDDRLTRALLVFSMITVILVAAASAGAQTAERVHRVGWITPTPVAELVSDSNPGFNTFRQEMRQRGYVEGQNLVLELRSTEAKPEQIRAVVSELVRLNVDIIVAVANPTVQAVQQVTRNIPIVMFGVGDPVAAGIVTSLARPGGNITGLSQLSPELSGKRLELLRELLPGVSRVAVLWNPANPGAVLQLRSAEAAARALGVRLQVLEAQGPGEIDRAFAAMRRERAGALLVVLDSVFLLERERIADLAAKNRLPAVYGLRYHAEAGGLMAYGANVLDLVRGGASYVDKILKGAKPADLPIEQPIKFELVINLKTAKALGLTIPPSLLGRADEIIQ